jgi:hypothetical protein
MDKIDKYLCNLFNNDKSAGVIELKEELKCHLLDMAHEFISQGHSKEEAYDMAINKFDIDNDVLKILCENVKENNKKLEGRNKMITKSIKFTKIITLLSAVIFVISFVLSNMDIEQKTQHNKWIDESKRFEETFNKFVSSRDVNSTDQYKSELDKLLKSNEWNCVYRLYVYEPVYTYQVKGGTSNFETSGQTEKNGKGQVLYYRLKLKDIVSTKIVDTVKIISIYTTLIFFAIFMILKRQYKKL